MVKVLCPGLAFDRAHIPWQPADGSMKPQVHVYCGPTISAAEAAAIVPGAVTHPPVCHGDLLRLDPAPGLTVIIIDGAWHQVPAVRHKEIMWLLAHGAAVAGAASMGALRAAELHPWGMTGTGDIYRAYRDGILAGDDEVAVAMAPGDWRPLSVAMADITDALAQAAAAGALSRAEAAALADRARSVHYAGRTWQAVTAAAAPDLLTAMSRFSRWRAGRGAGLVPAKLRDARQVLRLAAAGTLPGGRQLQRLPGIAELGEDRPAPRSARQRPKRDAAAWPPGRSRGDPPQASPA